MFQDAFSSEKEKKLSLHVGYLNHFPKILTSKLFLISCLKFLKMLI